MKRGDSTIMFLLYFNVVSGNKKITFESSPATRFLSSNILSLMERRYLFSMTLCEDFLSGFRDEYPSDGNMSASMNDDS